MFMRRGASVAIGALEFKAASLNWNILEHTSCQSEDIYKLLGTLKALLLEISNVGN